MTPCAHGMPSPASCIDCMDDGNLPVQRVEPERRAPGFRVVSALFPSTVCGACDNKIHLDDPIVLTTRERWVHEECVS